MWSLGIPHWIPAERISPGHNVSNLVDFVHMSMCCYAVPYFLFPHWNGRRYLKTKKRDGSGERENVWQAWTNLVP